MKKYAYGWLTLAFFLITLLGHWIFGWFSYVEDQQEHHQAIETASYIIQMSRDTLENWQSEFLQLLWQVGGLSLLLYVGSPQSKEADERKEEKIDAILKAVTPVESAKIISRLDEKYSRK